MLRAISHGCCVCYSPKAKIPALCKWHLLSDKLKVQHGDRSDASSKPLHGNAVVRKELRLGRGHLEQITYPCGQVGICWLSFP